MPLQYKFAKLDIALSPALFEQLQTMETVHLSSLIRQEIKELRSLISPDQSRYQTRPIRDHTIQRNPKGRNKSNPEQFQRTFQRITECPLRATSSNPTTSPKDAGSPTPGYPPYGVPATRQVSREKWCKIFQGQIVEELWKILEYPISLCLCCVHKANNNKQSLCHPKQQKCNEIPCNENS